MRLPRLLVAGLLLLASVFLLTALYGRPSVGAVAVFVPLWLTLAVVNAAVGAYSAGYRPSWSSRRSGRYSWW